MNRNCYRIVFNACRGQRMAVAETASGAGQAAGGTRRRRHAPVLAQGAPWARHGSCLSAVSLAVCFAAAWVPPVNAQIIADPAAPANRRPTVLSDAAGRPLVNIQTPSAAGLSRNTYRQFDVPAGGIVLNNTSGNPWLSNGVLARTILNEVNATTPSALNGTVTVNGAAAQVIVANPSGINVNGGGFVNASRATLVTGTAQVDNGALASFQVRGGAVTIGSAGLNSSATPFTDILSRAVTLTGRVQAQTLALTTGLQTIDYDTGLISSQDLTPYAAGGLAIDTGTLGGMVANNISLLATEAGLGVRNQGLWQAGGGQIIVTADGLLQNLGTVQAGVASLATVKGNVENAGPLQGSQAVVVSAGGNATLYGSGLQQTAGSAVVISAKGAVNLVNHVTLGAAQVSSNAVGGQVSISAGKNLVLQAGSAVAAHTGVQLSSDVAVVATSAGISAADGDVTVLGAGGISLAHTSVTGRQVHLETGAAFKDTNAVLQVAGGTVRGQEQTTLRATGNIVVQSPGATAVSGAANVHLQSDKSLAVVAGSSIVAGQHMSLIGATGVQLQASAGSTAGNGQKATVVAGGNLLVSGGFVHAVGSDLSAGQALSIEADRGDIQLLALANQGGESIDRIRLNAGGDLNVSAFGGSLYARGLQATGQNLDLASNGTTSVVHAEAFVPNGESPSNSTVPSILRGRDSATLASINATPGASSQVQLVSSSLVAGGRAQVLANGAVLLGSTMSGIAGPQRASVTGGSVVVQGGAVQSNGAQIVATGDNSAEAKSGALAVVSTQGGVTLSTFGGLRTEISSTGNTALHANGDLVHSFTRASANGNLSNASATGTVNVKGALLHSREMLSFASPGAQSHAYSQYVGGAVSLYSEGGPLGLAASQFSAIGGAASLGTLDGQLSLESGTGLSIDAGTRLAAATDLSIIAGSGDITLLPAPAPTASPGLNLHTGQFSAGRDLTLIARNGTLRLGATAGSQGNPTASVVSLNVAGKLTLGGAALSLAGSQLLSGGAMNLTSYWGDLLIDGVKNDFTAYLPWQRVAQLQARQAEIQAELAALKVHPQLVDLKRQLAEAQDECFDDFDSQGKPGRCWNSGQISAIRNQIAPFTQRINDKNDELTRQGQYIATLSNPAHGSENLGAWLSGSTVNISSGKGIAIYGASITAADTVAIQSAGVLPADTAAAGAEQRKPVGISIAGLSDFYEFGTAGSSQHAWALMSTPSTISGAKGVQIRALGDSADARLVLNDSTVRSAQGAVRLQSLGDMRLESGQQEYYSFAQRSYKTGPWYHRRSVTETRTTQNAAASPVRLSGQSIDVRSGGSLDAYATQFDAPSGALTLTAADALGLWAVNELDFTQLDVNNKRGFVLGLYMPQRTTTVTSREVSQQLPAKLVAERVATASGWDTRLQGTVFEAGLSGASIAAGVGEHARADAQVVLEGIRRSVTTSHTRSTQYDLWQRQLGQGSTTQTLALPDFKGVTAPRFSAPGGLVVQLPEGSDFKTQVSGLQTQSGLAYLNTLLQRSDVDWRQVKLAHDQWQYDQQGLTPAGAALVAVVVAYFTGGWGANALGTAGTTTTVAAGTAATTYTTAGLMANAAVSSLAAQAAISLINNQGNLGKTFQDLGSSQTVKATIAAALTAGVLDKLGATGTMTELQAKTGFSDKLTVNLINATGRAMTNTAISGGSLEDALKGALIGGLVDTAHGQTASQIKLLESDYLAHKLAHALAGCVAAAAAQGTCRDGAIGAAVGEVVAEMFKGQKPSLSASAAEVSAYNDKVLVYSKLVAGAVSAFAGGNAQTAITTAEIAVQNNYLSKPQLQSLQTELNACKQSGCTDSQFSAVLDKYVQLSTNNDAALAACTTTACVEQHRAVLSEASGYSRGVMWEVANSRGNPALVNELLGRQNQASTLQYMYGRTTAIERARQQLEQYVQSQCLGLSTQSCTTKLQSGQATASAIAEMLAGFTPVGLAVDIKDLLQANSLQDYSIAVLGAVLPGLGDGIKAIVNGARALPIPSKVTAANGLKIESNPKHTLGQAGNRRDAGLEPRDSLDLFNASMPDPTLSAVRWAIGKDGDIHRFTGKGGDGTYHWNGSSTDMRNPLGKEVIPYAIRVLANKKRKG